MPKGTYNWNGKNEVNPRRRFNWAGTFIRNYTVIAFESNQWLLLVLSEVLASSCTGLHIKATIAPLLKCFCDHSHLYLLTSFCDGLLQDWWESGPFGSDKSSQRTSWK